MQQEIDARKAVAKVAQELDMLSVMSMTRSERRRLAKVNGIKKIAGSNKPFVKNTK